MNGFLQDWLTRAAREHPGSRAIVTGSQVLTYGDLDACSSRLADVLAGDGCRPRDRVAVLMPKGPGAITSFLGVLKAGCTYVPLDPEGPAARTASMLSSCAPRVLLASESEAREMLRSLGEAGALGGIGVRWLDAEVDPWRRTAPGDPGPVPRDEDPPSPEDPAYILFTSGSTGTPKGVPISHTNVRHLVEWAVEYFELGPGDRLSGHSSLTFDLSVLDIYAALASGGELHPVPPETRMLPHRLVDFIRERALTFWFSVPSQLAYVARFDALASRDLPSLRHVAWCGDVLPTPSLLYWKRSLDGVAFTNLYGPTETTVASSFYRVPDDFDDEHTDIPIGRPCPGEELLFLDERMEPVPDGVAGHLYIRGVGLSVGYWQDPHRTSEAFVPDPGSDDPAARIYRTGDVALRDVEGNGHFLGRADFQIKTSGYRVEPAEIEHALLRTGLTKACVVVPVPTGGFEGAAVGCAFVPANGAPVAPRELRAVLGDALPRYMIPSRWLALQELPLNSRGKVDRNGLRDLLAQHGGRL